MRRPPGLRRHGREAAEPLVASREVLGGGREQGGGALADLRLVLTTETVSSSSYAAFRRLSGRTASTPRLPEVANEEPERVLEERFARLAANGDLEVRDPRRAVQHFAALTMRLVLDAIDEDPAGAVSASEVRVILADGVDAFLRAYGAGTR